MLKNNPQVDYLILSAMLAEQSHLLNQLESHEQKTLTHLRADFGTIHGKTCCLALTSAGTTNAAAITSALIHEVAPKAVVFVGCAGAIQSSLSVGDVVLGKQAYEIDIQGFEAMLQGTPYAAELTSNTRPEFMPEVFSANSNLLDLASKVTCDFDVLSGLLVTTNAFPAPMHYFDSMKKRQVAAIDMESSAVYQVCWLYTIPCLAIRSISNAIHDDGSEDTCDNSLMVATTNAAYFMEQLIKIS